MLENWTRPWLPWVLLVCLSAFALGPSMAAQEISTKPRLVILTDIGGDPDDQQSLVRLMVYANEFDIEALIATSAGTPGELDRPRTREDLIEQIVGAYDEVRDQLALHADAYPTAAQLLENVTTGSVERGRQAIGAGYQAPAAEKLIEIINRDDPRPVNLCIWGGQTDLAQALWIVKQEEGDAGVRALLSKVRVHDINDQDNLFAWMEQEFPFSFYILSKAKGNKDKREGAYRGMYLGGNEDLTSKKWLEKHVTRGHGPLGALYPTRTWTAPNPHAALKEGDTPSWFYFLPTGLSCPQNPDWGGWGGRFTSGNEKIWRDATDSCDGVTSARATVWRWRAAYQNDFAARMDWCVMPFESANHPPRVVINGAPAVQRIVVGPERSIVVDASTCSDPDDDTLSFYWWVYREPSGAGGPIRIHDLHAATTRVDMPSSDGFPCHLVLEVTDNGNPPLTRYGRVVLTTE